MAADASGRLENASFAGTLPRQRHRERLFRRRRGSDLRYHVVREAQRGFWRRRVRYCDDEHLCGLDWWPIVETRAQPKFLHASGERFLRHHHPLATLIGARPINQPIAAPDLDLRAGRRPPGHDRPTARLDPDDVEGRRGPGLDVGARAPALGRKSAPGVRHRSDISFICLRWGVSLWRDWGVHGAAEEAAQGAPDGLGRAGRRGLGRVWPVAFLRARRLLLFERGLNIAG